MNPYVWLAAVLIVLGSYGTGRYQQYRSDDERAKVALLAATQQARTEEQQTAKAVSEAKDVRNAETEAINGRLLAQLDSLRKRPARLPAPARPAAAGATGAELSGPDAEFLAGEATRADKLRAALAECYTWVGKVAAGSH